MAASTTSTPGTPLTLEDEDFLVKGSDVIDIFDLECEVCKELFNLNTKQPKLLPCKHTLCSDCLSTLRQVAQNDDDYDDDSPRCPQCKVQFSDKILPNDHRVMKGLEIVDKARATFKDLCLKHDCKKLDRFCETCDEVVCSDCIRFSHDEGDASRVHSIVDLTKSLKDLSLHFDELEKECTTSLGQRRMNHNVLKNVKRHLELNEMDQISNIEKQFEVYNKKMQDRKEALINMVKNRTRERLSEISLETQQLQNSTDELQKLYDQFSASRKNDKIRVLFKTRKQLIGDKRDLRNVSTNKNMCATFEFQPENGTRLEAEISVVGNLKERVDLTLQCPRNDDKTFQKSVFQFSGV